MKMAPLMMVAALGVPMVSGCGGEDRSDLPPMSGQEAASPADPSGDEEAQIGSGESADVQAFLRDYEALVDKYCEFADRFSKATLAEMAQLGEEMAAQGREFTEFSSRRIALEVAFSARTQERLDSLQARADACTEKIGG